MTPEQMAELREVNAEGNAIAYDDLPAATAGEDADLWKDTPDQGGWYCRDYTQWKANRLKALGWPATALSVILCWVETGEYHAVLGAQLPGESETWVLDNRRDEIYSMTDPPPGYRWDRRQIAGTVEFEPVA